MYTDNFIKVLKRNLFDNNFSFKTNFETPFYFCQMVKKTFGPSTYLVKEHFTTLTNHNQQHSHNIIY
jgi:hypothetical protein